MEKDRSTWLRLVENSAFKKSYLERGIDKIYRWSRVKFLAESLGCASIKLLRAAQIKCGVASTFCVQRHGFILGDADKGPSDQVLEREIVDE